MNQLPSMSLIIFPQTQHRIIYLPLTHLKGFPCSSVGKESAYREGGSGWGIHVNPWLIHVSVWQKPLQYCKVISLQLIKRNGKQTNRKRICLQCRRPGFDPWVVKGPLEKEMATHSSILAWKISWTEEPGGLQSMGHKELGTTE